MPIDHSKAISIDGIYVYDESVTEHFGRDGSSAERIIVVDWTNRVELATKLLGTTAVAGTSVTIVAPATYPDMTWLKANSIDAEGVPGSNGAYTGTNGLIAFDYSRFRVTYGNREDSGPDSQERGSYEVDFSSEVISFSKEEPTFKWESDSQKLPPEATPGTIIPIMTFSVQKKGMHEIPRDTLLNLILNPVNSDTCLGVAAGKLRFEGVQTNKAFTVDGNVTKTMSVKLSARPIEWNKFFRPAHGTNLSQFEYISVIGGTNRMYGSTAFSVLGLE